MKMTREKFLKATLALAGVAAGAAAVACGGDDEDGGSGGSSGSGTAGSGSGATGGTGGGGTGGSGMGTSCAASISANHGHSLTVSSADVEAGVDKSYTLSGPHDHPITVTAADFGTLASSGMVVVTSEIALGHGHDVTITCSG